MSHDMALCEMILACQLLAGNWSDLHANCLCLLKDVGESGTILARRGCRDVSKLFFLFCLLNIKLWKT